MKAHSFNINIGSPLISPISCDMPENSDEREPSVYKNGSRAKLSELQDESSCTSREMQCIDIMSATKSAYQNNGSVTTISPDVSIRTRSNPRWNVVEPQRDDDDARNESGTSRPCEEQGQERAAMSEREGIEDQYTSNMDRMRPPAIRISENDLNDLIQLRVSRHPVSQVNSAMQVNKNSNLAQARVDKKLSLQRMRIGPDAIPDTFYTNSPQNNDGRDAARLAFMQRRRLSQASSNEHHDSQSLRMRRSPIEEEKKAEADAQDADEQAMVVLASNLKRSF